MVKNPHASAPSTAVPPRQRNAHDREHRTFSVGPYEVHDFIGTSNTGHVFRARHEQLQQTVALKVLPLPATENNTGKRWSVDTTTRHTKHIEAASRVVNDNVVRPIHLGEQNNVHYVAMEYVDGVSLETILRREGPCDPELACEVTQQVASGLRQIHENGLVHGAICPANILLTKDGKFKIAELGISELAADAIERNSGAPGFLAPEQVENDTDGSLHEIDARADIFSLGCVLYELIFGTPAFNDTERKIVPAALRGGQHHHLSPMLLGTLSGMLARAPAKRVQSAKDVVHAMRNWADSDSIEALVESHINQSDVWDVSDEIAASSGEAILHLLDDSTTADQDSASHAVDSSEPDSNHGDIQREIIESNLREDIANLRSSSRQLQLMPRSAPVPNRFLTPVNVAIVSTIFAAATLLALALIGFRSGAATTQDSDQTPASTIAQSGGISAADNGRDFSSIGGSSNQTTVSGSYHDRLAKMLQTKHGLPVGRWMLGNDENTCINDAVHYGHLVTQSSVYGQQFTRAVQMIVEDRGGAPWDAGYFVPGVTGLQTGDRLLLAVWLRTESVQGREGRTGTLRLFCEEEDSDEKDFYVPIRPTSYWQRYLIPFHSRSNKPRRIGFHIAYSKQTIEFGGLALLNYGDSVSFGRLPSELNSEEPQDLY